MRPLRQLIRQPLKSLAGILLAALAVAILCISTAQTLAAANTVRKLNDIFVTVALPTAEAAGDGLLWAEEMAESHPEIFRGSYHHGLASAWIPDLTQDNYTQHLNKTGATNENYRYQSARTTATTAMFVITLTEANIEQSTDSTQIIGQLIGVVEEAIGLEPGYYDPTGFTLRMSAANLTPEQLEASGSELIVGKRYLVYGTDYQDLDWQLRSNMANIMVWREEKQLLEWELDQCTEKIDWKGRKTIRAKIGDLYHGLSDEELPMFRSAALTLSAPAASSPAIVRLTGTAEEFFSSADGALWKQALSDLNINCSTFPIIGVDNLSYLAGFATGKATISTGRSFTAAELTSGAKVCILSQSLAEANGLSVGDTIDPHFYEKAAVMPGERQIGGGDAGFSVVNPVAYRYREGLTPFVDDAGPYTIVGLYTQREEWVNVDDDFYAFTPNTIFAPKAALPDVMDLSDYGMFHTFVLNSDHMRELQLLSVEDDMDATFYYYDNGYSTMVMPLKSFQAAANRLLPLGLIVYGVVMLLFLFLFPGRQGRTLAMMDSQGASLGRRVWQVLASCLGLLIPATVLGTGLGLLLWKGISESLSQWIEVTITVELEPLALWAVSGIQVLAMAAITVLIALPMAKHASLMKRK